MFYFYFLNFWPISVSQAGKRKRRRKQLAESMGAVSAGFGAPAALPSTASPLSPGRLPPSPRLAVITAAMSPLSSPPADCFTSTGTRHQPQEWGGQGPHPTPSSFQQSSSWHSSWEARKGQELLRQGAGPLPSLGGHPWVLPRKRAQKAGAEFVRDAAQPSAAHRHTARSAAQRGQAVLHPAPSPLPSLRPAPATGPDHPDGQRVSATDVLGSIPSPALTSSVTVGVT